MILIVGSFINTELVEYLAKSNSQFEIATSFRTASLRLRERSFNCLIFVQDDIQQKEYLSELTLLHRLFRVPVRIWKCSLKK
jgi:hypothetical protein